MTPEELEALAQQTAQRRGQGAALDLESLARQAAEQNQPAMDPVRMADLDNYARQLREQQGAYETEDLIAAGFTEDEISAYERAAQAARGPDRPRGDGSMLSVAPPNTAMYDGFRLGMPDDRIVPGSDEEITAYGIFNEYRDATDSEGRPLTESGPLGYVYNNTEGGSPARLPRPDVAGAIIPRSLNPAISDEMLADQQASVPLGVVAASGVEELARNTAELGAAGVDYLRGDEESTFTNYIQDNWPTLLAGNKTDALVQEGTAMALGFFGGGGVAGAAARGTGRVFMPALSKLEEVIPLVREVFPTTNRILQFSPSRLAQGAGAEVGMVASMDSDTQALLFGEDGLLGRDFNVLGVDPNRSDAEAVLAARTNLLADAILAAGVFEGVARGAARTGAFATEVSIGSIVQRVTGGLDSAKQRVVSQILDEISAVEAQSTRESMDAVRQRLVTLIRDNADIVVGDDPVTSEAGELVFDVFSAMERGNTLQPQTVARLRELRAGAASRGGTGDLTAAMGRPAQVVEDTLDREIADAFSEGASPAVAVDNIVDAQRSRLATQETVVRDLETAIESNDIERVSQMLQDPRFGAIVERLGGVSPSQVSAMSEEALQRLGRGVIGEISAINIEKDRLFSLIPEGVPFDYNSFASDVANAVADRTDFDTAGQALLGNRLVRALKNGMEEAGGVDVGDVANLNIDDAADFAALMEGSGLDFRRLYTSIRPQISNLADEAFAKGDREVAQRLVGLRSAIDDQVDWVAANSDGEAAQAATAAMDFYRGTVVPLLRDDPLETVDQTVRQNTRRVTGQDGSVTVEPRNPNRLFNTVEANVRNVVQEGTGRDVAALQTLLSRQGSDVTPEEIETFIVSDVFEQMYSQIRSQGLENLNQQTISDLVQRYGVQLRGLGLDSPLAGQLDTFADRLRMMQGNKEALQAELDAAAALMDQMRNDAVANVVAKFVSNASDDLVATADPANALRSFVSSRTAADDITALLQATNNNPVVIEGLTAAYYESLRSRILGAAETISGARVINPSRVRAELEERTGLSGAREVLAQQDPRLQAITASLLELAGITRGQNSRAFPAMSGTAELQQYQGAVNRLIYFTVGPLNRAGTQMRAFSNLVAERMDIVGNFNNAMSIVTANSKEFADIAELILRRQNTVGIGPLRMDRELADRVFTLGVRAGLYAQTDVAREEFNSFWEEAANWEVETTQALREADTGIRATVDRGVDRFMDMTFGE